MKGSLQSRLLASSSELSHPLALLVHSPVFFAASARIGEQERIAARFSRSSTTPSFR